MSDWKEYKLDELVEITSSKRIMRSEYQEDGILFFRSKEIIELNSGNEITTELFISKERFLEIKNKFGTPSYGDILLTSVGTLGVPYFVNYKEEFYFKDGNLTWFRKFNNILRSKYLYYWFSSPVGRKALKEITIGSTQPALTITGLKSLTIHLPTSEEQDYIIQILDHLSSKIQLNTQINQTLEQIAQALFKSWFVDFDPVRAKVQALSDGLSLEQAELAAMQVISGKTPEELTALLQTQPDRYAELAETAKAFPCEMVEVDGVKVPKGWEVKRIDEIANIIKGKSYKSSELEKSKTALVTLKSFNRGGGYRLDGLKEYTGKYKPEQEVFAGELIIAYTDVTQAADVIGKPAMVMSDSNYQHLVISLDVGVVRPFNGVYKHFLYCLAMTDSFQAHTKSFCTGTTVLHLGKDAVPSFEFINPSNELLHVFYKQTSPIFEKINLHIEENKNLEKARDLLLPRLLNGEI